MSLFCILVDDEPKALTSLNYELGFLKERIQVLQQFSDAKAALTFLETQKVDVVFLDVDMPGMNGFAFLDMVPQREFEVVLTTAHSQYGVDAFKKEVFGYLVKPIDAEDLESVIKRLEKKVQKGAFSEKIEAAIDLLNDLGNGPKKIKLSLDKKIVFVEPDEVLYCESDGNYCKVILDNNKEFFLTQKLKQVAELMPPHLFYRVHNSFLINLQKVKEFHKNDGIIVLEGGIKIPVSRQKRNEVLERL